MITLLCILSKPIIILLYSKKWELAIPFLQLVCISGLVNSVIHTNFSVLKSVGCSDLFLISQVIINSLKLLLMFIGMRYGVIGVISGHVIGNYIGCGILSFLCGKAIGYGLRKQICDLFPSLFLSIFIGAVLYFVMNKFLISNILIIFITCLIYGFLYFLFSGVLGFDGFRIYKEIIIKKH